MTDVYQCGRCGCIFNVNDEMKFMTANAGIDIICCIRCGYQRLTEMIIGRVA